MWVWGNGCVCGGGGGGEDGEDEFMCTVYMHRLIPRFPFSVFVFC